MLSFYLFVLLQLVWISPEWEWARKGNALYAEAEYGDAEVCYRRCLQIKPDFYQVAFNLGNALYRQERYAESIAYYRQALKDTSKQFQAEALHNLGNCYLKLKKLPQSINSYTQSLRLRPGYIPSQYNLAYAQQVYQQKKSVIRNVNKARTKETEKQGDPTKKQEKSDQATDKNGAPGSQNGTGGAQQSDGKTSQQRQAFSKEDVQNLLEALDDQEKNIHKRLQQKKQQSTEKVEKDW